MSSTSATSTPHRALYDELRAHTLVQGDSGFSHQNAVDAYAASHLRPEGPSIAGAFTLAGLHLAVERGFSGRQVQRVHTLMARRGREWPRFMPRTQYGAVTVADILAAAPGAARDVALAQCCASIWAAFEDEHARVREMVAAAL